MTLSINVSKEDFLPALNSLQSITGKKGTMAILANVLIQTQDNFIELITTDLEVGIKKNVLKLDKNGKYHWHTFYGSAGNDIGMGISAFSDGVYVTGYSPDWNGTGGIAPLNPDNTGPDEIFILKLIK